MALEKKRGRPKGTDLREDRVTLRKIAETLTRHPEWTATKAIREVVPDWTDTIVRRLRGKWKNSGASLLADAKAKAAHFTSQETVNEFNHNIARQIAAAQGAINALAMGYAGCDGAIGHITAAHHAAMMRAVQITQGGIDLHATVAAAHDAELRVLAQLEQSHVVRSLRAIQDDKVMRSIQEAHRVLRAREIQMLSGGIGWIAGAM